MAAKKERGRFSLRFNISDPIHLATVELLEKQPDHGKAQYIAKRGKVGRKPGYRKPEEEKELKITIPENLDYTGLFDDLFGEYTRSAELISVRTTGMGSLYNLHYHVRLVSPEIEKQFLDAIRCRNGNLDIVCGKVPQVKEAL